jgi:hypothetical protein
MLVVSSIGRIKGEAEPIRNCLQRSSIIKVPEQITIANALVDVFCRLSNIL